MPPPSPDPTVDAVGRGGLTPPAGAGARDEPAAPASAPAGAGRSRAARAWAWWAARPALGAAAIYAVLSIVFVGQGLLPGRTLSSSDMLYSTAPWTSSVPDGVRWGGANFELADAVSVFQPFFEHTRRALPSIPLWNSHVMGGRPYLANAQAAIFSPFSLPAYVLPLWTALGWIAVLKLWVAAFGTYVLGRALGMRFGGALLAGVVFAFGTFFVAWLAWPLTNIFPLLPWLLLLAELVVRRPAALPVAGLAALVGLAFLGGHPETSFHVLLATVVFFAFRVLQAWWAAGRRRSDLVRPAVAFGVAMVVGTVIAAVMLVPLFELLVRSGDYARRLGTAPSHADAHFLPTLFLFDYWGRPTQTPLAGIVTNRGYYAGGLTLILAVVGLILRPAPLRAAFAAFGAAALVVVLGIDPFFAAVTKLPGFRTAHNGRMVIFVLFALAMLAGWGLDELSRRERPPVRRRTLALAAAVAIFAVPFVGMLAAGTIAPDQLKPALKVAWGFADPPPQTFGANRDAAALLASGDPIPRTTVELIRLSALLQWLVLAGLGCALVVVRLAGRAPLLRRGLPVAAFVALAVTVLTADLFRANMGFNPAIPRSHATQPETPALRLLQSRAPNRFAGLNRPGIGQPLQPDLSMRYGLYDARGYDYPVEERYDRFWRATAAPPGDFIPPTGRAQPTAQSMRGLSLLSVTDVLQDPADPPVRLPGLRVAYDGPDGRVYRNDRALPRAFLVTRQRTVGSADAALAATVDPAFDARHVAVTEKALPGLAQGPARGPAGPGAAAGGSARLTHYGDERATVTATATAPSLVVLTDSYFRGWKATVDGRDAPIEHVDYLLRGVRVPAGTHRVEFRYAPSSFRVGWVLSLLGLVALAALLAVGLRARRRERGR